MVSRTQSDGLMLVHSGAVFLVCIVLDCEGAALEGLCLLGVFVYALHSTMLLTEDRRSIRTSMLVHHLLAIIIQSMFWYFADSPERPLDLWKVFGWTELGSTLHKLATFIPSFQLKPWKRHYQALYLACYLVSYGIMVVWIAGLSIHHPSADYLLGVSTTIWHIALAYGLIALLLYWWYQSFQGLCVVLQDLREQRRGRKSD